LVIYGGAAEYYLSSPPSPWQFSGSVTWTYRQTAGTSSGEPSEWRSFSGGLSWDVLETIPGSFQIIATATLQAGARSQANPNPATAIASGILTVDVKPPDKIVLPKSPLTAKWNVAPNGAFQTDLLTLNFPVTCAGQNPILLPDAAAYENLTNYSFFGRPQKDAIGFPIIRGGVSGTSIMDQKQITAGALRTLQGFNPGQPNSYPPNFVFVTYQQTLILQIPDMNGDLVYYPLGPSFTFTQTSSNGLSSPTTVTIE
jgi:hypothetical protein